MSSESPSSPPVAPPGLRRISTEPACAKARVTIANEMPVTRSASDPTVAASTMPKTRVTTIAVRKMSSLGHSTGANASSTMPSP